MAYSLVYLAEGGKGILRKSREGRSKATVLSALLAFTPLFSPLCPIRPRYSDRLTPHARLRSADARQKHSAAGGDPLRPGDRRDGFGIRRRTGTFRPAASRLPPTSARIASSSPTAPMDSVMWGRGGCSAAARSPQKIVKIHASRRRRHHCSTGSESDQPAHDNDADPNGE